MWGAAFGAVLVAVLLVLFAASPGLFILIALPLAVIATPILLFARIVQERRRNDEGPAAPKRNGA